MLVLGDSVVWGQGLREDEKFYSAVRQVLVADILRRSDVRMVVRAHSGATIMPKARSAPRNYGEVPAGAPTLYAQAHMASDLYDYLGVPRGNVRLVLLDGGINDIGFSSFLNPFTKEEEVRAKAEQYCHDGMRDLLASLAGTYPNALLVVTGYFPIITAGTKESTLRDLVRAFLNRREAERAEREERSAGAGVRLAGGRSWLFERLGALSRSWKTASDNSLAAAASDINGDAAHRLAGACPRVLFVKVELADDEGYNAPNSALWHINEDFRTEDPFYAYRSDPRTGVCHLPKNKMRALDRQACDLAATGHPNRAGADKYAKAIIEGLRPCAAYLAG
ncbi:MAG TPA: SGNH/GDSL hydrolase family protein [Pyrinomonadaceae bacterium]|nr:SGNH/GDSL hydrolase family protein [Pyrinomonadaceae bacterium]